MLSVKEEFKKSLRVNMVLEWENDRMFWGLECTLSNGLYHILLIDTNKKYFYSFFFLLFCFIYV